MVIFGYTYDLFQIVNHINKKYSNNPITFLGFSAGTGIMVRYLGDMGLLIDTKKQNESLRQLLLKEYDLLTDF